MSLMDYSYLLADKAAAPPPAAPAALEELAFLIGGIWVSRFQSGGTEAWRSERFEWDLDRQFIRSRATLIGVSQPRAMVTKGRFGVDPATGLLLSWAFASEGSYSESRQVIPTPPDLAAPPGTSTWLFQGRTVGSTGTSQWTSTLTRVSDDKIVTSMKVTGIGGPIALAYERRK